MLRNLRRNIKAQNTAEYALLIALVVGAIIAMQDFVGRALKAKMRDASVVMAQSTKIGNETPTLQYQAYYEERSYDVTQNSESNKRLGDGTVAMDSKTGRTRATDGFEKTTYNTTLNGMVNGI